MAKLADSSLECGSFFDGTADAALAALKHTSDNLPDGEIVGALLSFPIADGYAFYTVTSASPLTVQHVNYGDAWSINGIMVKGLDRQDVLDHLTRQKALDAFHAKYRGNR